MVFNAILNALKSGVQGDPQRIEELPQRVEGGIPFFFLPLRMRRNHNGLACQELLTNTYFFSQIRGSRQDAEWLQ